jgi:hypothetical protein
MARRHHRPEPWHGGVADAGPGPRGPVITVPRGGDLKGHLDKGALPGRIVSVQDSEPRSVRHVIAAEREPLTKGHHWDLGVRVALIELLLWLDHGLSRCGFPRLQDMTSAISRR